MTTPSDTPTPDAGGERLDAYTLATELLRLQHIMDNTADGQPEGLGDSESALVDYFEDNLERICELLLECPATPDAVEGDGSLASQVKDLIAWLDEKGAPEGEPADTEGRQMRYSLVGRVSELFEKPVFTPTLPGEISEQIEAIRTAVFGVLMKSSPVFRNMFASDGVIMQANGSDLATDIAPAVYAIIQSQLSTASNAGDVTEEMVEAALEGWVGTDNEIIYPECHGSAETAMREALRAALIDRLSTREGEISALLLSLKEDLEGCDDLSALAKVRAAIRLQEKDAK